VAGALGTAKAPLTNTAFAGGEALGACELGSSLPIWPDGDCWAFSCCDCRCASAGGGCCLAAARPGRAANASASGLVRKRAFCMALSFSSAARGRYPALPMCLVSGGWPADIPAGADVWFRAARAAALIGDLGHHNAGRGIDQQQAVV